MLTQNENNRIIRQLSKVAINRIAAGEVVERPASVVKELVENSIDAGAKSIEINIQNGGRNLISISDDGIGMTKKDLELATERHTTSKLDENDILNIQFFGFRGEALPSIASVSKMKIISKTANSDAWQVEIDAGENKQFQPSSRTIGTFIEVRDLFCSTPARLKFLKAEKTEASNVADIVKKLSMAHPKIAFKLISNQKTLLDSKSCADNKDRISDIMKNDFIENSVALNLQEDEVEIKGFASLPTHNRGTSSEQYLYVNGRSVRDKILLSAIKAAYQDYLARDRHPYVVIFINLPFENVDVNVHPAKTEVRFRNASLIRGLIIKSLRNALNEGSYRTSSTISDQAIHSFKQPNTESNLQDVRKHKEFLTNSNAASYEKPKFNFQERTNLSEAHKIIHEIEPNIPDYTETNQNRVNKSGHAHKNLGVAKCQLHETYIISQTEDSIIITDQHAAHERLVYERIKQNLSKEKIETQRILIPEVIELDEKSFDKIIELKDNLSEMGLIFEQSGINSIIVSEIPALIGNSNVTNLIKNICDDLIEYEENLSLNELIEHILGTFSCHRSVRAGRKLSTQEMNELLRQMEETAFSGQCNHGRPTYVELNLKSVEKLFGRS